MVYYRVQGGEILPKLGRPTVFSQKEELTMETFLLDCWFMMIPRTKENFAYDVQWKVLYEDKKTPFTNGRPGPNQFTFVFITNECT